MPDPNNNLTLALITGLERCVWLTAVPFGIIYEYPGALDSQKTSSLTGDGPKPSGPALIIDFQQPSSVLMKCLA